MKLLGKIFLKCDILLKTGLHIGGSSSAINIGGVDGNVIKNSNGIPYIPGSSIKGKMRSLMELKYSEYTQKTGNVDDGKGENGNDEIHKIFGTTADKENKTRIIVRDAFLKDDIEKKMKSKENEFNNLELDYTEVKWENTIDRLSSSANPRQLERVPAGAVFDCSIVFNLFDKSDKELFKKVIESMKLLEDDYIGGSGSRGYGQILFENITIQIKNANNYENNLPGIVIANEIKSLNDIKLDELIGKI